MYHNISGGDADVAAAAALSDCCGGSGQCVRLHCEQVIVVLANLCLGSSEDRRRFAWAKVRCSASSRPDQCPRLDRTSSFHSV